MAIGAQALARKVALVTRLSAIDELASVTMRCSDKTGTLTLNHLSLGAPFTLPGVRAGQLLQAAALASEPQDGDVPSTRPFLRASRIPPALRPSSGITSRPLLPSASARR
jgi:H+-transporting ATPase